MVVEFFNLPPCGVTLRLNCSFNFWRRSAQLQLLMYLCLLRCTLLRCARFVARFLCGFEEIKKYVASFSSLSLTFCAVHCWWCLVYADSSGIVARWVDRSDLVENIVAFISSCQFHSDFELIRFELNIRRSRHADSSTAWISNSTGNKYIRVCIQG